MENLYLVTGDDLFEREKTVEKIKNAFGELVKGINFVVIDKEKINLLQGEVTTYPFGFDKKLIIVNIVNKNQDADETLSKNDWFDDELMESILNSIDMNVIVFNGNFQVKSKIYKFVSQNGKCIDLHKPKNKKDITPWVVDLVKKEGKAISNENAAYIVHTCGADKMMLYNEIQKLIDFTYDKKEITKKDIDEVGIRNIETIIFDLTDSLGARNVANSIKILEELLMQKEPLQKIFIMIAKHFKSLLVTKICMSENRDVANELNIKFPFIVNKYKDQARKFTRGELENLLLDIANLDVDSKIGKIDLKTGLEITLVKSM